jgi:hypothetical protein
VAAYEKGKVMKITRHFKHLAAWAALLTVGLAVTGCASSGGKSTTRVYEERKFIPLYHVKNTGDELNLKKGDAVAMACAKCKTVLFADVNRPRNRFFTPFEHRHYCPGCKSTITVTGRGFGAKEQVEHTCDACGSDSVFCCATHRGAPPTEGMSPK